MGKILELKHISKKYKNREVLSDVSLDIYQGEIYGLLGKNGIGKTTLLKIITNIIPKKNIKGELELYGTKLIGSLIENPACYMDLSVKENLDIYGVFVKEDKENKIKEVIDNFELHSFLNKKAKELSLGMLQKLKLAMAFLSNGELLILDEPFNGLDIDGVISLRKQIKKVCCNQNKAIIITSHNTDELDKLCDRFGVLHKGNITEISKEEGENLEDAYINILNDRMGKICC